MRPYGRYLNTFLVVFVLTIQLIVLVYFDESLGVSCFEKTLRLEYFSKKSSELKVVEEELELEEIMCQRQRRLREFCNTASKVQRFTLYLEVFKQVFV